MCVPFHRHLPTTAATRPVPAKEGTLKGGAGRGKKRTDECAARGRSGGNRREGGKRKGGRRERGSRREGGRGSWGGWGKEGRRMGMQVPTQKKISFFLFFLCYSFCFFFISLYVNYTYCVWVLFVRGTRRMWITRRGSPAIRN
jgi:hypothetical protein